MAEIIQHKSLGKKIKKIVRVDLTPMVDLGFLLITFFILTTSLQKLSVLKLVLPKDSPVKTEIPLSTALTFILERHDSIGFYEGTPKEIKYAGFAAMRNIILKKQVILTSHNVDKDLLTIIIKPSDQSTYKNFIDALDEITIANCKRYFITEPEKNEILTVQDN